MPLPNPLAPSRANSCLSNALLNTPTPLHLVNVFLTRHSFGLSSSSHQVDSRHPHQFPTQCLSTFTLLRQVYSQRLISLATAVGRSPIVYLPCSMRPSLSFSPSIYLYVPYVSSSVTLLSFLCLILSSPSPSTLVSSIFILSLRWPYFIISYFPYDPFLIVQINPIITTPRTCINTLSTSCYSPVW